jgi:glutathione S-transferase
MQLYYVPGACSLAPHIVARELALPVSPVKVDLATRIAEDGRPYAEVNPKGYVPALRMPGGEILTEVAAVLQYLVDQAPEAALAPQPGTLARSGTRRPRRPSAPRRSRSSASVSRISTRISASSPSCWATPSPPRTPTCSRC